MTQPIVDTPTLRRIYARQIVALVGDADRRLEDAFGTVPREAFLGDGPWRIVRPSGGIVAPPENDPALIYQDVLVALAPAQGINNGSPSLHARMLHALDVQPGQRVVHLGAGTGYYTAILAELVGPDGSVLAVEYDGALAEQAARNLAPWRQVGVAQGDAFAWPRTAADRIYVNFAVFRPADTWLDNLNPGGRLLFPIGVPKETSQESARHSIRGAAMLIENAGRGFAARAVCPAYFIWAAGAEGRQQAAHDAADLQSLKQAFDGGGIEFVRSLIWKGLADPGRCWFWQPDWALSYDLPAA